MTIKESAIYHEWRQEALQEGIQQAAQSIARNLLDMSMDPAQIAAVTGLTLEQIRQLQN